MLQWVQTFGLLCWDECILQVRRDNWKEPEGGMLWADLCTPKFICWDPNPQYFTMWLHLDTEPLKGDYIKIRSLKWVLIQYDWCLFKKKKSGHTGRGTRDGEHTKGHVRTQPKGRHSRARKRRLRRNQMCQHLDFGLPVSRTVRK